MQTNLPKAEVNKKTNGVLVKNYSKLPVVALKNMVLFPSVESSLLVGRKISKMALVEAYDKHNKLVLITTQKKTSIENPNSNDLYEIGVLARIDHILQTDDNLHTIVTALHRVRIVRYIQTEPFFVAEYENIELQNELVADVQNAAEALLKQLKKAFAMGRQFDLPAMMKLSTGVSSSDLADQVCYSVGAGLTEKQKLLETISVKERLAIATELLMKEMKVAELERDIEKKTQKKFDTGIKRNVLEERKRQIEKELRKLGKEDGGYDGEFDRKLKNKKIPREVRKKLKKELNRLKEMGSSAPEASYIKTYLQTVLELPWGKFNEDNLDIKKASEKLDKDHYGLEDVKDRILEHLAVLQLRKLRKNDGKGSVNILCFIGPPGVGKTSIGKSIADAMGRKFVRASLGGIRDESEIRGHRRTYVGAMPGRIIKGLIDAKSMNPVFMLDEVDKIGSDYRGDPAAALLETLDPEQNKEFTDHYIDLPIDLSKVFFILTGNSFGGLPGPLRDRVEIIEFSGYTISEKLNIAKKYLAPRQIKMNGLKDSDLGKISDETWKYLIEKYTREAGVRNLDRKIASLFRKIAKNIVLKKKKNDLNNTKNISKLLGPEVFSALIKGRKNEVGVSTGLAWSPVGGSILFIEVNIMEGTGKLILTGKLGEVMKESCQAAVSYVRSNAKEYGIDKNFSKIDIHIHVPEGATPKDGPSAGSAITTALISALTGKKVSREIGMTGEITIRGNVLEIGGLKEKAIAAHRAGLKKVLIPKDNNKDLTKMPKEVQKDVDFVLVERYDQIFKTMFPSEKLHNLKGTNTQKTKSQRHN